MTNRRTPGAAGTAWQVGPFPVDRPLVAYGGVSAVLFVALAVQTINQQWSGDHWMHQAVLETLRHDLFDTAHPLVGGPIDSEYISPYTWAQAGVLRVTGLNTVRFMQLMGLANLILLLVTFWLFVSRLTANRWATVWSLVASLVLWGPAAFRWSGFLNLNSIGFSLHYPATFATGCAFLAGWIFLGWTTERRTMQLVALAVLVPVTVLSHPFTGAWTIVMLAVLAVSRRAISPALAVSAAVAAALVLMWPAYSVVDLIRAGSSFSMSHDQLYERVLLRFLPALPGFVYVVRNWWFDHRDPLGLLVGAAFVLYAVGFFFGEPNLGRFVPLLMLPMHIGTGLLIVEHWPVRSSVDAGIFAVLAVAAAVGLVGIAPGLTRMLPQALLPASLQNEAAVAPYDDLESELGVDMVIAAENRRLRQVGSAFGASTVVPGYPAAFVEDVDERRSVVDDLFGAHGDAETRTETARRQGVDGVLCHDAVCADSFEGRKIEINDRTFLVVFNS